MFGLSTLAIATSLAAFVAADHGHNLHARDHKHVRRAFSGMGTYYITGLGACGQYNNPGDKIVALNSAQYGGGYPGPQCFKMVRICEGSNCHNAQIVDECPTCAYGSLDMSQSLFEQFHTTDVGTFPITWTFVDGNNDDDKPTTTKKPTPTSTWKEPEPTTTWKPEPTTTWEPETTTTKKKKTTTSSPPPETTWTPEPTTTSSTPTTTSTTEAAAATSAVTATSPASAAAATTAASGSNNAGGSSGIESNLEGSNQAVIELANVVFDTVFNLLQQ